MPSSLKIEQMTNNLLVLTYFLTLIIGFFIGRRLRNIEDRLDHLGTQLRAIREPKKAEKEQTGSILLDADDPIQVAQWEHKEMMNKLNPPGKE